MNLTHPESGETWYDLEYDWELIESSFLKQYGIRLRTEDDMSYGEFCSLLSGIMHDTPLGQVVSIRAEKDRKVISRFTEDQKRIRREWMIFRNHHGHRNNGTEQLLHMQSAFKAAYGKNNQVIKGRR